MSGKVSRRIRKSKKTQKKMVALGLAICMGALPMAANGDFIVSLYPHITKPFGQSHKIESGIGGGVKFTYRPLDYLNIFLKGDYLSLSLPNIDPITLLDAGLGLGYHLSLGDRMALDLNFDVGAYNAKSSKSNLSGISAGVGLTFTWRLNPVISADVQASGTHYASGASPLMTVNAAASPGLSFNLTELFTNKTNISVENQDLAPVFPVLYSWYENNSFGKVKVQNQEDSAITNVTVSFYQPQYMTHPKECGTFKSLKKGETAEVDLYAFFNEQMLELTEKTDTKAQIIVSYSCLGQKKSKSFDMVVPVYGRNNMSWDDDRRAAVFVSSKDPAALLFGKYITSIVRDNVRNGVPVNIQYAMGIFEALDQFGLSYVIDPSSAFADNVGTSSIDFLQFPYQTLMYRGGDCDDLSILVCSLFEAVGIRTAFITVPGHIFMAFDSGLTISQAMQEFSSLNELIVDQEDNKVWVPLEITLSDEGFNKAWRVGAREWNTASKAGTAALYKMSDSWKIYQPVSVPGATAYFTMPDSQIVAKLFDHSVDQWITREIEPQIKMYEAKLAVKDDVETRNCLGVLYGKYGLFLQADEQFKKARRQGYQPAIINTGNIYFSRQDYTRARKWYKSVLKDDPDNTLALLGVARCAYELTDYAECDAAYSRVVQSDPELAAEYAYLGTFVSNKGRAFSLADRLQHTIWPEEKEKIPEKVQEKVEKMLADNSETEDGLAELTEDNHLADFDFGDMLDLTSGAVALVPDVENGDDDEDLEDYDLAAAMAGDGDKDPDPDQVLTEEPDTDEISEIPEVDLSIFTENFTGLASEVALAEEGEIDFEDFEQDEPVQESPVVVAEVVDGGFAVEQSSAEKSEVLAEVVEQIDETSELDEVEEIAEAPAEDVSPEMVEITPEAEENTPELAENVPVVTEITPELAESTPEITVESPEESPVADVAEITPSVVENASEVTESVPEQVENIPELTEITSEVIENTPVTVENTPETVENAPEIAEITPETAEITPALTEITPDATIEAPLELATSPVESEISVADESSTDPVPLAPAPVAPVEPMAVPRFTKQPSSEWAPEAAYQAETIPGMKSFEEEMGEYQNEKAFLYTEEKALEVDPENDFDQPEVDTEKQYANAGIPDVNPFSSYLSEEDAKVVEEITNYSFEEVKTDEEDKFEARAFGDKTTALEGNSPAGDKNATPGDEYSPDGGATAPGAELATSRNASSAGKQNATPGEPTAPGDPTIAPDNNASAGDATATPGVELATPGEPTVAPEGNSPAGAPITTLDENKTEKSAIPLSGWLAITAGGLAAAVAGIFGIKKIKKGKKKQN